jgi:hypothetical protein
MRLRLLLNIGDDDVRRLDLEKRFEGETVDVKQAVADEMLRRGWATDAAEMRTTEVAAAPETGPNVDEMTKEELKAFADANAIEGVTMEQHKDEMVKTVKRATRRR